MASPALAQWRNARAARIDELLVAHAAVGGTGPGRRVGTEQLNWSLTLRLAGEFQGYCRDLHDLAVDCLVSTLAPTQISLASVLRASLTLNRELDKGNAHPGTLGRDFARLGFQLWPALKQRDVRTTKWQSSLDALNRTRNAIAHVQDYKLSAIAVEGYPMRLKTIKAWRSSLNGLAGCMDSVVADSLAVLLGTEAPW